MFKTDSIWYLNDFLQYQGSGVSLEHECTDEYSRCLRKIDFNILSERFPTESRKSKTQPMTMANKYD